MKKRDPSEGIVKLVKTGGTTPPGFFTQEVLMPLAVSQILVFT